MTSKHWPTRYLLLEWYSLLICTIVSYSTGVELQLSQIYVFAGECSYMSCHDCLAMTTNAFVSCSSCCEPLGTFCMCLVYPYVTSRCLNELMTSQSTSQPFCQILSPGRSYYAGVIYNMDPMGNGPWVHIPYKIWAPRVHIL